MIFLGDIASPDSTYSKVVEEFFSENTRLFSGKNIICNLEGLLYDGGPLNTVKPVLYNHPSILKTLKQGQTPVLCLANNHVLDLPEQYRFTTENLIAEGMLFTGAGLSREEAARPVLFGKGARPVALFNGCWDFLLYNHNNPLKGLYVSVIKEDNLISSIREFKLSHQDHSVIAYFHWSLDLEILPFPMYRNFSRALIDAGADLVIGAHSHCVQGGEIYNSRYILYGLGNFFIPGSYYANGKLNFPDFAGITLGLEWDAINNRAMCHWFEHRKKHGNHQIEYLGSDEFETSDRLKSFSPYQGMSDKNYIDYFRQNRRKKFMIPVFSDYKNKKLNFLSIRLLSLRANVARFLAKLKIIGWQR